MPFPGSAPISWTPSSAPSEAGAAPARLRTYGRRQGHALSPRQRDILARGLEARGLPAGGPLERARLFPPGIEDVALEIGSGGGEHVAALAAASPRRGFIACEPFVTGQVQLLTRLEREALDNVRLHPGDAREVFDRLAPASLAAVYLLFPDPWPKRRHWKRRFVSPRGLDAVARVLRPEGEFRVASDSAAYITWTLAHLLRHADLAWQAAAPGDALVRPAGWPATRYEAKALRQGARPVYLLIRRLAGP